MNVSWSWLRELFPDGALAGLDPDRVAQRLTLQGLAVDEIRRPFAELEGVVLGRVLEAGRHPNADRLTLCRVAAGDGERQVVCGAPNVEVGTIYAYATEGARLPGGREIRRARIRGVESQGMLCSAPELGLEALGSAEGIWPVPGVGEGDLGRDLVEVLDLDDRILVVDVASNRGDLLCHLGMAREAQWLAGAEASLPVRGLEESGPRVDVAVEVEDREGCPAYLGRLIRGVAVGPSPAWLQVRLLALGARPVNNVVDATNWVMLECGQPLHPFDAARLAGRRIVVRRPRPGEEIVTLDGRTRRLDPETTVIADGERAVAVGGVMGGLDSEVGAGTSEVFLEAAWFEPARVARTARGLGLRTDAAIRFSRGVDPAITAPALDRAAALIAELAGGRVAEGRVGDATAPAERPRIELRTRRLEVLVGRPIAEEEAGRALRSLGFAVRAEGDGTLVAGVPSWRFDVEREVDLIEEVARTTGYDMIPAVRLPAPPMAPAPGPAERALERVREILRGAGYDEARTPTFVGEAVVEAAAGVDNLVEIRNPISKAERFLRPFLIVTLAGAVVHNLNRGASGVRLFEIGHAFRRGRQGGVEESRRVSLAAIGPTRPADWSRPVEPTDFFDVKGTIEELLSQVGAGDVSFAPTDHAFLHAGRRIGLRTDREVGFIGEVHPAVAEGWGVEGRLVVAELALDAVTREPSPLSLRGVPREPAVERDLALIVPEGQASERVVQAVREAGVEDLVRIEVFDRYRGPQVPDGHLSLGLRLTFQAERTLTDESIDARIAALVETLGREHGYRLR